MFFSKTKAAQVPLQQQTNLQLLATLTSELSAIKANTAFISFTPDGKVLDANKNFLDIVGYSLTELVGQHHQLLCEAQYVASAEYRQFWQKLASGTAVSGTFLRFSKKRQPVYLEASYFPVQNDDGSVTKVIKIANDVTAMHNNLAAKEAVFTALDKSLAVIEFLPDGTILTANQNFLDSMQYQLTQVVGKQHKIFCDQEFYHNNPDFWRRLAAGNYASGRYKRLNSRGEVIWLEATYNPIFDESGKVFKVVKFAADITDRVNSALNAVEMAAATSEQTSQITTNAAKVLAEAIETSHQIANQVKKATDIGEQLMQQSKSIDDIVTTIRAIADQTNLLALNAAIEAARAGDSGRGFAVVADEVRKLAARTAGATAEISTVVQKNTVLIHDIDQQLNAINSTALHGEESINSVSAGLADVSSGVGQFVTMVEKLRP